MCEPGYINVQITALVFSEDVFFFLERNLKGEVKKDFLALYFLSFIPLSPFEHH